MLHPPAWLSWRPPAPCAPETAGGGRGSDWQAGAGWQSCCDGTRGSPPARPARPVPTSTTATLLRCSRTLSKVVSCSSRLLLVSVGARRTCALDTTNVQTCRIGRMCVRARVCGHPSPLQAGRLVLAGAVSAALLAQTPSTPRGGGGAATPWHAQALSLSRAHSVAVAVHVQPPLENRLARDARVEGVHDARVVLRVAGCGVGS